MPVFISAFLGGLAGMAGSLVGRVLVALGVSVVTYTGMSTSLAFAKQQFIDSVAALPPEVVGLLSAAGVGSFISIITSALTARLVLNGLTGDTIKRWVKN